MPKPRSSRRLILLELNEVNFDVVERCLQQSPESFPSLKKLLAGTRIRTTSEKRYEELEPWIQWASVHSGLSYAEHRIFRLGDIVGSGVPQVFEKLESQGFRVGSISAMNAENRLKDPAYFIPDPWTRTPTDGSWWSEALSQAVSQAVNDNAQSRLSIRSALLLALGFLRFARPRHYFLFLNLVRGSRGAPWRKALVLDLLLHDVHFQLFRARRPEFSTLFLNGGAHIQHHHFLDAEPIKKEVKLRNPDWYAPKGADPVAEMLTVYDRLVGEYLSLPQTDLLLATGLSQRPYDRIKYYYRLKDHASFLREVGVAYKEIMPRMTRDFLVEFDSPELAASAQSRLTQLRTAPDDLPLFGEIDNRGSSLFVTLTYPNEINDQIEVRLGDRRRIPLKPHVAFVAIKNGMHQDEGFAFFTPGVADCAPQDHSHVKELHGTILRYFTGNANPAAAALASQRRSP